MAGSYSLNNAQELLLTKLSYLDFAEDGDDFDANFKGKTLKKVAEELLESGLEDLNLDERLPGGLTEAQFIETLNAIAEDSVLGNMSLTNYVNKNGSGQSGYVGYALTDEDNSTCVVLSRGSESNPLNGSSYEDWIKTNIVGIGITGSASQFNDAVEFARSSCQGYAECVALGHSLGAALSLYIAGSLDDFVAYGYDGPGIGQMLSSAQLDRLINSGSINYVASSDFAGPIRYISEITVFVETNQNSFYCGGVLANDKWWSGHCQDAVNLVDDYVVPTSNRTAMSYVSEVLFGGPSYLLNTPFRLTKRFLEGVDQAIDFLKNTTTDDRVEELTNSDGSTDTKILDAAGNVKYTEHVNSDSSWSIKEYDTNGNIEYTEDGQTDGSWIGQTYENGKLVQTEDVQADGSYTDTTYDPDTQKVTGVEQVMVNVDGSISETTETLFTYNGDLLESSTMVMEDSSGNKLSTTQHEYTYDDTGEVTSVKVLEYNSSDQMTSATIETSEGITYSTFTYDDDGNLISTTTNSKDSTGANNGSTNLLYEYEEGELVKETTTVFDKDHNLLSTTTDLIDEGITTFDGTIDGREVLITFTDDEHGMSSITNVAFYDSNGTEFDPANEFTLISILNHLNITSEMLCEIHGSGMEATLGSLFISNLYGSPDMMAGWVDLFNVSETVIRRDPLAFDLDGDGLETVATTNGAYFDHDANGFAEQTGWVSGDDGLLVMDRDNDGVIEDGTELFGDQTILKTGKTASDGFEALAEWDDNKDGKIDANDAIWSKLKIWQDADGDGYSSSRDVWGRS